MKNTFLKVITVIKVIIVIICIILLTGCGNSESVQTDSMFTESDMEIGYDEETATVIEFNEESISCDDDSVNISEGTVTIADEGTYIVSGKTDDGMIIVDSGSEDKIRIILDGAEIQNSSHAVLYVKSADKVFITTAAGSQNSMATTGEFVNIDENNMDAVIFSKADLTLNGAGTLDIVSAAGHGIVSKDDLVMTSGSYKIEAAKKGLSGKDSVRIADGEYTIEAGTDGINAENEEDAELGFVYIKNGSIDINAADDGIHAETSLKIKGGSINIAESYEGLEGLTVDIDGGNIDIFASDDGINSAGGQDGSGAMGHGELTEDDFEITDGAYIKITDGKINIDASGDGIDSNGDLYITGGEIYLSGPTDNGNGIIDYAGEASISGGTFIAAGSKAMTQNFDSSSSQAVIFVQLRGAANETVSVSDSEGNEIISWSPGKEYESVIISSPEIKEGNTYEITGGESSVEVEMSGTVYSDVNGQDGLGVGGHDPGQMGKPGEFTPGAEPENIM